MSGKFVSPALFSASFLLIIINGAGIIFFKSIYNINILHTAIMFIISAMLFIIITFIFRRYRRSEDKDREILKLCGIELSSGDYKNGADVLIKNRINFLQNTDTEARKQKKYYDSFSWKLKVELEEIACLLDSKKKTAEELMMFRNEVAELVSSVKQLEKRYADYDSTIKNISKEQSGSAENMNEIVGSLLKSIEKEAVIAARAEEISSKMIHTVKSGGDDITKTISLIAAVEQFSGKISEIIAVIDNITDQTNLLAMNAAIEAAHAGDSGKGFAVVAGEIQKLSKETSKSSGKISDLVKNVSATIKDMTSNAENASGGLKAIMDSVTRTEDIVKDITGAIKEQSEGGSMVLNASESIIKTSVKIDSENSAQKDLLGCFPEVLAKIESCSNIIDAGVDNILSDLVLSEERLQNLISSIK